MTPRLADVTGGYILITGGCGFIGTNLAHRFLSSGRRVCVYDNLSRPGVERNLDWLRQTHGDLLTFRQCDTRDAAAVRDAVRRATHVFHFAAQVAVTTSITDALTDFEINARGTLNVLEVVRASIQRPPVFFTSTNKVYGGLDELSLGANEIRYSPADLLIAASGVSESRPLDFHSPYGCSKGAADQYVRDYARTYGLKTVVFRMSCIYGPHQFGTEDQGWVAHFLIRALNHEPITIFGDGKQVRDILFVEDLVNAFVLAAQNIDKVSGQAFNIGGGPSNTISLRELLKVIAALEGREPRIEGGPWRTGDQKYYVSDIRRFQELTGWTPAVSPRDGVRKLREWLIAMGVPAIVQRAEEQAVVAKSTAIAKRNLDRPIATIPVAE